MWFSGVARAQYLERICHTADRHRIAALAFAFRQLVYHTRDSIVVNKHPPQNTSKASVNIIGEGVLMNGSSARLDNVRSSFVNHEQPAPVTAVESLMLRSSPYDGRNCHSVETPPLGRAERVTGRETNRSSSLVSMEHSSLLEPVVTESLPKHGVSGLLGQLVWLGVGLARGPNGKAQVLLQGHSVARRRDVEGSCEVLQSPVCPRVRLRRAGQHNTIRQLGLKKGAVPSQAYVAIRSRSYQRVVPPKGPPPRKEQSNDYCQSFTSSDSRLTNRYGLTAWNSSHPLDDDDDIQAYHDHRPAVALYAQDPAMTRHHHVQWPYSYDGERIGSTGSPSLRPLDPLIFDGDLNKHPLQVNVLNRTGNAVPKHHALSNRQVRISDNDIPSPGTDECIEPCTSGRSLSLAATGLRTHRGSVRLHCPAVSVYPSSLQQLTHSSVSSVISSTTDEGRVQDTPIRKIRQDDNLNQTRIEDWIRLGQQVATRRLPADSSNSPSLSCPSYSEQYQPRHKSSSIAESRLPTCLEAVESGNCHSSYLDFLLASPKKR